MGEREFQTVTEKVFFRDFLIRMLYKDCSLSIFYRF